MFARSQAGQAFDRVPSALQIEVPVMTVWRILAELRAVDRCLGFRV